MDHTVATRQYRGFVSLGQPQCGASAAENDGTEREHARIEKILSIAEAVGDDRLVSEAIHDQTCTAEELAYLVMRDRAAEAKAAEQAREDMDAWENGELPQSSLTPEEREAREEAQRIAAAYSGAAKG